MKVIYSFSLRRGCTKKSAELSRGVREVAGETVGRRQNEKEGPWVATGFCVAKSRSTGPREFAFSVLPSLGPAVFPATYRQLARQQPDGGYNGSPFSCVDLFKCFI